MMELNKRHPRFSMAMELLCSLPVNPNYATNNDLVLDLQLIGQGALKELRQFAKEQYGVETLCFNADGVGRVTAIARKSWETVRRLATTYLDEVYDGGLMAA